MSLFVNTNTSSLNAKRQLLNSNSSLDKSFQRLSSGFRINSAADDAAGLQIGDRMTAQVNGLKQAARNANDGISAAQTAEGALKETVTLLQRIRTLAVQARNGINSSSDYDALQKEADQLIDEVNRIAQTTQFAGKNLLDGTFKEDFQVGANEGQKIGVDLTQFSGLGLGVLGLNLKDWLLLWGAARSRIPGNEISGGGVMASGEILFVTRDNDQPPSSSLIRFAVSTDGGTTYEESQVFVEGTDSATKTTTQTDAQSIVDAINEVAGYDAVKVHKDDFPNGYIGVVMNGSYPDFRIAENESFPGAEWASGNFGYYSSGDDGFGDPAFNAIDNAISRIDGVRADLGATQNRFQSALRSLSTTEENMTSARSRIMDADYALETANLTKHQIIQQAATSVLAQANTRPQTALTLLQN